MSRLLIHNALIVNEGRKYIGWLLADGAFIAAMGEGQPDDHLFDADEVVDASGCMLLPGAIDAHVHFREPGLVHKATIASESLAALAGGVTSYIDMPNCIPQTTTIQAWEQKNDIAARTSRANYGFMLGATSANIDTLRNADFTRIPAVKVFMASSTGNMLLDDDNHLRRVFAEQPGRVVVHAEDQATIARNAEKLASRLKFEPGNYLLHTLVRDNLACARATEAAIELATRYGTPLHVAHLSTAEEAAMFSPADSPLGKQITAEVSPHHLLWSIDDYPRKGARIKMNPAIKSPADRGALRQALREGRIDIVATDHAPHLLSEKEGGPLKAVSGAPMVQFSLPAMLDLMEPELVVKRIAHSPADLFGIDRRGYLRPGYYADLVLVQRTEPVKISDNDVLSLCGWTPMAGEYLCHRVVRAWVNGPDNRPLPLRFHPASRS